MASPTTTAEQRTNVQKYIRGHSVSTKKITDKKLKTKLRKNERQVRESALKAAKAEILLADEVGYLEAEGMEKTFKFRQQDIVKEVDVTSAQKAFSLQLDQFGPYSVDYTRNGRYLLMGGRKGHVAAFDWRSGHLLHELQLRETVRDVQWLHNESLYAVAQKKYTYIYDRTGLEIHCLRQFLEIQRLAFLPYHFLLAAIGNAGFLHYQDTSTGQQVASLRTKLGRCHIMTPNPWNAVLHLGHSNGTVTLWSPNVTEPLVRMLCHRGPLSAVAVDPAGHHMVTTGADGQMKVWDLRTFKPLYQYYTRQPATSLSISQKGLLAVGYGPRVSIWKDYATSKQQSPYMNHLQEGSQIRDLSFCPYDDVLAVGHNEGLTSLLIPGAGEPNYDALEANPYETKKQRQEKEVHSLLDKLQPDMITLDPNQLANAQRLHKENVQERNQLEANANGRRPDDPVKAEKKKARGKNSAMRRYLRKQTNVIDQKKMDIRAQLELERKEKDRQDRKNRGEQVDEEKSLPFALERFKKK